MKIVECEGRGVESVTKGFLLRGTRGNYRHAPVLREVDRERARAMLETRADAKSKKPKTQAQVIYLLKLKGWKACEELYHRTNTGYAWLLYRDDNSNQCIVLPDGTLEWYNGRLRAEYPSGWIAPSLMRKQVDKFNRTKSVDEFRQAMPINWNEERIALHKAFKGLR